MLLSTEWEYIVTNGRVLLFSHWRTHMSDDGVFSFQCGEIAFPPESVPMLVDHLGRLKDLAPDVTLVVGGKETVTLPGDVTRGVLEMLRGTADPVRAFLHRASIEM